MNATQDVEFTRGISAVRVKVTFTGQVIGYRLGHQLK